MSAFNGVRERSFYGDYPPQICSECGDEFPEIDEATELCDGCFEHIFAAQTSGPSLEGQSGNE